MSGKHTLKIFLSSPGDVSEERALAEIIFRRIANEVADLAQLELVIWEHEPVFAHTDFQAQVEQPSQCDLVVTILWSRLGTRLPAGYAPEGGSEPPTGTEWEVKDALESLERYGKPKLLVYRKEPGPQIALGSSDFEKRTEQWEMLQNFIRRNFFDSEGAIIGAHNVFHNSSEFEKALADHVRGWLDEQLQSVAPGIAHPVWHGRSPFLGLQAFDAQHEPIWFGRSEALTNLLSRLRAVESAPASDGVARILLVQGMSGTGKTSLFNAGLLPRLALRPIEGVASWSTLSLRPSDFNPQCPEMGPIGTLAVRLIERWPILTRLGITTQELAEQLRDHPTEAIARIEISLAADLEPTGLDPTLTRLFIYVDQLEESFALPAASAISSKFMNMLVALAKSKLIWVGATMRSDFGHRLEAFPELMLCLARSPPYTLLPPKPDEFADIIRGPAQAAALIWEKRDGLALDQMLLREVIANPEALPLLEYTLAQLYEKRDGRTLCWSAYGGELQSSLIAAADSALENLPGDTNIVLRNVLRELVGVDSDGLATRRYAPLERFPDGTEERVLLDRMIERRICAASDEGKRHLPVVRLAHEALIRSWPRAQHWLQQEKTLLQIRDELTRDAASWNDHGQGKDWLGSAPDKIAAIRQVERAGLMPGGFVARYAERSKSRANRNALIRRATVTAIATLALLAVIFAFFARSQRNAAVAAEQQERRQELIARGTAQFMQDMFKEANPDQKMGYGKSLTVDDMLKIGANNLQSDLSLRNEPQVRAALETSIGEAYTALGTYDQAEKRLAAARSAEDSSTPVEITVRTLIAYGALRELTGDDTNAEAFLQQAVDRSEHDLPVLDPLRSRILTSLADVLTDEAKFDAARAKVNDALALDKRLPDGPESWALQADALTLLGFADFYGDKLNEAEAPLRQALELREKALGPEHALTGQSLINLGAVFYESGRYDEALKEYEKASPIIDTVYPPNHPEVATLDNDIARSYLIAGQLGKSEPLFRTSLSITEAIEGPEHEDIIPPLNSLAMIDAYENQLRQARAEIERADALTQLKDHGQLRDQVLLDEAYIDLKSGERAKVDELLAQSKGVLQEKHPYKESDAWRYAIWSMVDALNVAAKGDTATASKELSQAEDVIVKRFGASGFYSVLAQREEQVISKGAAHRTH